MADTLDIRPWPDPVIDSVGLDPRSHYVETYWLSILGPVDDLVATPDRTRPRSLTRRLHDVARQHRPGAGSGDSGEQALAVRPCPHPLRAVRLGAGPGRRRARRPPQGPAAQPPPDRAAAARPPDFARRAGRPRSCTPRRSTASDDGRASWPCHFSSWGKTSRQPSASSSGGGSIRLWPTKPRRGVGIVTARRWRRPRPSCSGPRPTQ